MIFGCEKIPAFKCLWKFSHPVFKSAPLSALLGEGLFCVLGRPILQSSYRFPQYCNVSKASYSASGLFLFSGSIGSISIAEVYLLAHLVVIATLIHVAMLFPDAIHHRLHSRMFFNVQLLFGDGYSLRELVFWMPAVVRTHIVLRVSMLHRILDRILPYTKLHQAHAAFTTPFCSICFKSNAEFIVSIAANRSFNPA